MTHQDNKDLQETWDALAEAIADLNASGNLSNEEIAVKYQLVKRLNRRYDTIHNRLTQNQFRLPQAQNKPEHFIYMLLGAWVVAFVILIAVALTIG